MLFINEILEINEIMQYICFHILRNFEQQVWLNWKICKSIIASTIHNIKDSEILSIPFSF